MTDLILLMALNLAAVTLVMILFWLWSLRSEERSYIMSRIPGLARG